MVAGEKNKAWSIHLNYPVLAFVKEHKFLFFTYLVILFIPFIAFLFCIFNANNIMRRDAHQYQSSILKHEKSICDNMLRNGRIAAATASINPNTLQLKQEKVYSPREMLCVSDLSESLSDLKNSYPYISSIGIYFSDNDSFVTDAKRYVPILYREYLAYYGTTIDDFKEMTAGYNGYQILENGGVAYILIYQSLYDYSLKRKVGVSYALIPWDAVRAQTGYMELAKDELFLLWTGENVLFDHQSPVISADELPGYDTFVSYAEAGRNFFWETADDALLISGTASDELDLYYGLCLSKKVFYRDIYALVRQYGIGIALSIVIGICAALYFTKKNSAPLNHLLSILDDSQKKNTNIVLSESYRKLEDALLVLLRDNRRLTRQVYRQHESEFEDTLSGFLKGVYPNEDWILEFHESEPRLKEIGAYQIVLFCFSNIESCSFIRAQRESRESYSLLFFSLKNVIDEAFLEKDKKDSLGISIVMDNMVVCLVPACEEEDDHHRLIARSDICIDFFRKAFELDSCVAVSDRHELWTELSYAYEEAYMTTSHVTFWKDSARVNFYTSEVEALNPDGTALLQLKKNLSNSLMVNNYAMARELIGEIMESCFLHDIRYFTYNQCQAYALISMLLDKLSDMGMNNEIKTEYSSRLLGAHSTADLEREIEKLFDEMFHYQNENTSDSTWAETVKAYIRDNYCNPELNVSFIAEHFAVSAAHIGNRFRRQTGFGILDYVHSVRLARCKELLEQGSTIKSCADATGYTDIKTLQRAFKRYEGITPGQYKEGIARNQGEKESAQD